MLTGGPDGGGVYVTALESLHRAIRDASGRIER